MSAHYQLVSFSSSEQPEDNVVQAVLNESKDWLRFHGSQYLVYTTLTSEQLYDKLKPLMKSDGTLIVFQAAPEIEHRGWMSKRAVEWLSRDRDSSIPGI